MQNMLFTKALAMSIIIVFLGASTASGVYLRTFMNPNEMVTPSISNIILRPSDPLDTNPSFGWINITADVIDDLEISDVRVNITSPNASTTNDSMDILEGQQYWYNTTFTQCGRYTYFIWACDTGGNTFRSNSSEFLMPPNWDVDMDGEGNLLDLILTSDHYVQIGAPGWLREDINNDGTITILDLVLISNHYDENWLREHQWNTTCEGTTTVSISPVSQRVAPGEDFTVNISITSDQPIKGGELRLAFNASLIRVNAVTEGPLFEGFTTLFNPGTIDNTGGTIVRVYDLIIGSGNVTTPGTFVTLSCTAGSLPGISYLDLYNVGVANETAYVPLTVQNGSVTIEPPPNTSPTAPTITGPSRGNVGQSYAYVFNSTDPDGDDVYYYIDWGDTSSGWIGPYPSGVGVIINHTWTRTDQYDILAQAKDINDQESNWSKFFPVAILQRAFLIGFIHDVYPFGEYLTFDPTNVLAFWFSPFNVTKYTFGILMISKNTSGFVGKSFIIGMFDAAVMTNRSGSAREYQKNCFL
jgi:hypothetical protein